MDNTEQCACACAPNLLRQNMGILFRTKKVTSFNVYGHENGNGVLVIRTKPKSPGDTQPASNVSFKARNTTQQSRDRKRCADNGNSHGYNTRSTRKESDIEAPRHSDNQEDIMNFKSNLSPNATVFVPDNSSPHLLPCESPVSDPTATLQKPPVSDTIHVSDLFDTADGISEQQTESYDESVLGELSLDNPATDCPSQISENISETLDTELSDDLSGAGDITLNSEQLSSKQYEERNLSLDSSDSSFEYPLENCSNCGQNTEETNSLWVPPQPGKPAVWVYFCSDQCEDELAEKYSLQQSSKPKVEPKRLPPEKPGIGMLNLDGTYG